MDVGAAPFPFPFSWTRFKDETGPKDAPGTACSPPRGPAPCRWTQGSTTWPSTVRMALGSSRQSVSIPRPKSLVSMTLARTSAAEPGTLCRSTQTDSPGRPALTRGFLRRSDTSDIMNCRLSYRQFEGGRLGCEDEGWWCVYARWRRNFLFWLRGTVFGLSGRNCWNLAALKC